MVLETGQIWQMASGTVQIVRIGKTLVHYKHFKTMQQRGVLIQMQSHRDLIAALRKNGAKLAPNCIAATEIGADILQHRKT